MPATPERRGAQQGDQPSYSRNQILLQQLSTLILGANAPLPLALDSSALGAAAAMHHHHQQQQQQNQRRRQATAARAAAMTAAPAARADGAPPLAAGLQGAAAGEDPCTDAEMHAPLLPRLPAAVRSRFPGGDGMQDGDDDDGSNWVDMPSLVDASPQPLPAILQPHIWRLAQQQQQQLFGRSGGGGLLERSDSEPSLMDLNDQQDELDEDDEDAEDEEDEEAEDAEQEADDGEEEEEQEQQQHPHRESDDVWGWAPAMAAADDERIEAGRAAAMAFAAPHGRQSGSSRSSGGGSSIRPRGWNEQPPGPQHMRSFDLQLTDLFSPFGRPLGLGRTARRSAGAPAAVAAAASLNAGGAVAAAAGAAAAGVMQGGGSGRPGPPAAGPRRVWRRTGRVLAPPGGLPALGAASLSAHTQQQQRRRAQLHREQGPDYGDDDEEEAAQWEREQEQAALPPQKLLRVEDCKPPGPCSFLRPGAAFVGVQRLLQGGAPGEENQWSVRVVLHEVDAARGRLAGSMQAFDVAGADGPIDTFFEGELVDDAHATFWTGGYGASTATDLRHWSKFAGFADVRPLVVQQGGRCGVLDRQPLIYMRWKEQFFVNMRADCGLTIAGFYYAAMERATGRIRGFYFDPQSSPFQELDLQVEQPGAAALSQRGASSGSGSSSGGSGSGGGSSRGSSSAGGSSATDGGLSFASYAFA